MKSAGSGWTEPDITINGERLTFAQAMALRVAVTTFHIHLAAEGTPAELGEQLTAGYRARISEVEGLMFRNLNGATPPETLLTVTREGPLVVVTAGDDIHANKDAAIAAMLEGMAAAATMFIGDANVSDDVRLAAAQFVASIRHPLPPPGEAGRR